MDKLEAFLRHFNRFSFRGPLAVIVVVLSFAFLFMLLWVPIPEPNKDAVMLAAGLVLAGLGVVLGWYFGSSKDKADSDKAKAIQDIQNNNV